MKSTIRTHYRKALKVIDSCITLEQIEVARNYSNLFFKKFSTPVVAKYIYPKMDVREAGDYTIKCYNRLIKKLENKEKNFVN